MYGRGAMEGRANDQGKRFPTTGRCRSGRASEACS
jgi:hypothetical protein